MASEEDRGADEFARKAAEPSHGVVREFVDLVRHDRKWWLVPVLVALGLAGILVILGGTAAAPFLYTLF